NGGAARPDSAPLVGLRRVPGSPQRTGRGFGPKALRIRPVLFQMREDQVADKSPVVGSPVQHFNWDFATGCVRQPLMTIPERPADQRPRREPWQILHWLV